MKDNKFSVLRIISKGSFIELFLLLLNMIYFVFTTKYISVEERGEYSIVISLIGIIALLSNLLVGSLDIKKNSLNIKILNYLIIRIFLLSLLITCSYIFFSDKFLSISIVHIIIISVFTSTLISLNSLFNLFLYKQKKYYLNNYIQITLLLLSILITAFLVGSEYKIINFIYINYLVTQLVIFIILISTLKLDKNKKYKVNIDYRTNLNILVQDITTGSLIRFAPFILNFFISRKEIGLIRIIFFFVELILKYARLLVPFQRNFIITKEFTTSKNNFFRYSNLIYSFTIAIIFFIFKDYIVPSFFGNEYSDVNNFLLSSFVFSIIWSSVILKLNYINISKIYPSNVTIILLFIVILSYLFYFITEDFNMYMYLLSFLSTITLIYFNYNQKT